MPKPITIKNRTFPTQKKCKEHIQQMLKNIGNSEDLKRDHTDTYMFLIDLLQRHPDAPRKLTPPVVNLKLELGMHLTIVKEDGTEDTIGWNHCVAPERDYSAQVLRRAIEPQIQEFKETNDMTICGICKEKVVNLHADHIIPFRDLKKGFENQTEIETFEEYHQKHAMLRPSCAKCNMKRG